VILIFIIVVGTEFIPNSLLVQRKFLVELLQRRYPQYWSIFASSKFSWQSRKESLEEFIQKHSFEIVKEFANAGLHNNG
jgi:hypothetical protein